jgi:hypothetical protein
MNFSLTLVSSNIKTGKIPVSTSNKDTCPDNCTLKKQGICYAMSGPLNIHWNKITDGSRGISWVNFLEKIKGIPDNTLWRHNQAGDLVPDSLNSEKISIQHLKDLVQANKGKRGFSYTHYKILDKTLVSLHNRKVIEFSNAGGFTLNISTENVEDADNAFNVGFPSTVVLPFDVSNDTVKTPSGNNLVICPATYKDDVNCLSCQLCQKTDRKCIVGFPSHGTAKKKFKTYYFNKI